MKILCKFILLLFAAIIVSSESRLSSLINTTESNHHNHNHYYNNHRFKNNDNHYIIDINNNDNLTSSLYPMSINTTDISTDTNSTTTTTTPTTTNPVIKDLDIEESKNHNKKNNNVNVQNHYWNETSINNNNNNSNSNEKWSSPDVSRLSPFSLQSSSSSSYPKPSYHHNYNNNYNNHQHQHQQQQNNNNQQSSDYYSNHYWPSVQVIIEDNNEIRLTSNNNNNNHHHSEHNNHHNNDYTKLSHDDNYQHSRHDATMIPTTVNNDGFDIDVNNLDQKNQPQFHHQQKHQEQSEENPFANFFKNINQDFLNDFNSIDSNDNQNDHYQQQQSSGINIDQFQYLNDDLNNSLQNSDENESNKKFVKSIQHPTRFLEPKLISPSKIPDVYLPQQDSSSPKQQQHQELDNYVDYDVPKNEFTTGDKYQSYHSPEKSLMVPVGERVHFVRVNDKNQPQSSSIVSKLDYNKNEPYEPSVIELPSSQPVLPIVFNFKTKASPVIAKTTHKPSPQSSSVQYFETHEPPHYREHTVHKPVIQDFHEIIVPYRVYIQEIQPVNEFHHTIVSTTPNESKTSSSLPMNPYSSSSLSLSQSSASTKNPNPFQNFIDQHQYSHQYQRPYSYHSHQQQKRPHYQSYNHFNQLPMNYNPFLAASPLTPTMEMTNHMTKVPIYAPIEFNPIHHSSHNQWGHNDHLVPIFGNSQQIPSVIDFSTASNLLSNNIYATTHQLGTATPNHQKSTNHINNFNHFNF